MVAQHALAVHEDAVVGVGDVAPAVSRQLGRDDGRLVEDVAQAEHGGRAGGASGGQPGPQLAGDAERVAVDDDDVRAVGGDDRCELRRPLGHGVAERQLVIAIRAVGVLDQPGHLLDAEPPIGEP